MTDRFDGARPASGAGAGTLVTPLSGGSSGARLPPSFSAATRAGGPRDVRCAGGAARVRGRRRGPRRRRARSDPDRRQHPHRLPRTGDRAHDDRERCLPGGPDRRLRDGPLRSPGGNDTGSCQVLLGGRRQHRGSGDLADSGRRGAVGRAAVPGLGRLEPPGRGDLGAGVLDRGAVPGRAEGLRARPHDARLPARPDRARHLGGGARRRLRRPER